jgi:hypothetical protein
VQCRPAGCPRTCDCRIAGKLTQSTRAPKVVYSFLHYVDPLPDSSGRLTQSDRPLGQLQIVCCKRHQLFGHGRLSTRLGEPDATFGQLSMVFGSQHSRTILRSQVASTKTTGDGLNSINTDYGPPPSVILFVLRPLKHHLGSGVAAVPRWLQKAPSRCS